MSHAHRHDAHRLRCVLSPSQLELRLGMFASCPASTDGLRGLEAFNASDGASGHKAGENLHNIGWTISGICAVITTIIALVSVFKHARNYHNAIEQRQILRILYMPPIYAIISFFSYHFYKEYTYYSLVQVVYESVTLSAFMLLLIEYVASTATNHSIDLAMARKDKQALYFPFCFWRFRPTKPYFMYTIKWSVMQYVIIRPAVSIAAIICQYYNVLCESTGYNRHYAAVYLDSIDCVSISISLYGLAIFYGITREELNLAGRRPLAKFLCIKLVVCVTWYQAYVISSLQGTVIRGTPNWSAEAVADGLTAFLTCIEMVLFAIMFAWAYPVSEYLPPPTITDFGMILPVRHTKPWGPILQSLNFADFIYEIAGSLNFFVAYAEDKPGTHSQAIHSAHEHAADTPQQIDAHMLIFHPVAAVRAVKALRKQGKRVPFDHAFGLRRLRTRTLEAEADGEDEVGGESGERQALLAGAHNGVGGGAASYGGTNSGTV